MLFMKNTFVLSFVLLITNILRVKSMSAIRFEVKNVLMSSTFRIVRNTDFYSIINNIKRRINCRVILKSKIYLSYFAH